MHGRGLILLHTHAHDDLCVQQQGPSLVHTEWVSTGGCIKCSCTLPFVPFFLYKLLIIIYTATCVGFVNVQYNCLKSMAIIIINKTLLFCVYAHHKFGNSTVMVSVFTLIGFIVPNSELDLALLMAVVYCSTLSCDCVSCDCV